MKTTFLSIIIFGTISVICAQQMPNASFELWTGSTPDNWDTSNELILTTQYQTVQKETVNVQHGSFAAKVTTETRYVLFVGNVTLPGILTLGDFILNFSTQEAEIKGGIPFTGKPTALNGYYKATQFQGDSAFIGVGFSKWNSSTNHRDTIGLGLMYFKQSISTWTPFSIPITWNSTDSPDSCNIMIVSSDVLNLSTFVTGSTIWVDNLSFEYPVSVGGNVTGTSTNICEGESTGTLTLSGQTGSVLQWQKRLNGGSWLDIIHTATTYSEVPSSSGLWEYRALVQNQSAPAEFSNSFAVNVHENYMFMLNDTITQGDTYIWRGSLYDTEGIYYDSLQSLFGCDSIYILNLTVLISPIKTLFLSVFLESLYSTSNPGTMLPAQGNNGAEFGTDIADLILIEFHDPNNYSLIIFDTTIFLTTTSFSELTFPASLNGSYYLTVKHRNSIETVSSFPVSFAGTSPFSYDFTLSAGQAYGNNLKAVSGGFFAIYGADANQDGIVDASDMSLIENASTLIITGYSTEDINGDGIVDGSDMSIIENNSTIMVQIATP